MRHQDYAWVFQPAAPLHESSREAAQQRQALLTKPMGALGRLEEVAIHLAALQGQVLPCCDRVQIVIFAADHGVAVEGVSAFPQAVTAEMLKNFDRGGAAICVLAQHLNAELTVVNLGTVADTGPLAEVIHRELAPSTANFARTAAMVPLQMSAALAAGQEQAQRAQTMQAQLFIGGEMGIANTTSATAIACALLGEAPSVLTGAGTGLNHTGIEHKAHVIQRALDLHRDALDNPLEVLCRLGGFEIAALVGAYIASAQLGIPVLVDGFICSVAALLAVRINPSVRPWLLFSHASAERGHALVMAALAAKPLLDLGMRLGEGSGAATAVPLLRVACALHQGMATFAEAGVSEQL